MEQKKASNKKLIFGAVILAALVIAFAAVYMIFAPKGNTFDKTIEVSVAYGDETGKAADTFKIQTNAEFLRGALEEQNLIAGTEGEYGLYVLTVNNITADEAKQEWWCLTQDGGQVNTGVDSTPIFDGNHYELTLTTGWE